MIYSLFVSIYFCLVKNNHYFHIRKLDQKQVTKSTFSQKTKFYKTWTKYYSQDYLKIMTSRIGVLFCASFCAGAVAADRTQPWANRPGTYFFPWRLQTDAFPITKGKYITQMCLRPEFKEFEDSPWFKEFSNKIVTHHLWFYEICIALRSIEWHQILAKWANDFKFKIFNLLNTIPPKVVNWTSNKYSCLRF